LNAETPRTEDVVARRDERASAELRVAGPGKVLSYDAIKQTADVQPMWMHSERDDEDDSKDTYELPVLKAVPVCWPRGGGYFCSFPLTAGDGVLLVFSDRNIGAWRDSGQLVDSGDERTHTLGGAVAYPGLDTVARAIAGASADHAVLGKEGGSQVHVRAGEIRLGSDAATSFVALSNLVQTALDAIRTMVNAHVHTGVTTGAGSSGPPATPLGVLGPVASAQVKSL
jgi:hypothetical protein